MGQFDDLIPAQQQSSGAFDDLVPQGPANALQAPPASSDAIGGTWGSVLDYFNLQKQAQPPEQHSYGAQALEGLGILAHGMVPHSLEEAKQMVKPPMETNVDEQMRQDEELGKAWRGEYGLPQQVASIGGSVVQSLPLAHLPFTESPLRPSPADLKLVQQMRPADAAVRESMAQPTAEAQAAPAAPVRDEPAQGVPQPQQRGAYESSRQPSQEAPNFPQAEDISDPLKSPAIKGPDGKIFTGLTHGLAADASRGAWGSVKLGETLPKIEKGWVTQGGRFMSDAEALDYARNTEGYVPPEGAKGLESNKYAGRSIAEAPLQPEPAAATIQTPDERIKHEVKRFQDDYLDTAKRFDEHAAEATDPEVKAELQKIADQHREEAKRASTPAFIKAHIEPKLPTPDELSTSQAQAGQRDTAPGAQPEPAAVGGAGAAEGATGGSGAPSGISNSRLEALYGEDAIPSAGGRGPKALKQLGQDRLANFDATGDVKDDPYAVLTKSRKAGIAHPDDVALLRAEHQRMVEDAKAAEGTPEWNQRSQFAADMATAIKQVAHGPGSDILRALQEADEPRFDSITDFDQVIRKRTGKEMDANQVREFSRVADEVRNTDRAAQAEADQAVNRTRQYRPKEIMSIEEANKSIEDQITELTKPCKL